MTTPVNFETSKLLKDNEFDKITNFSYNSVGIISSISNRNSDGLFISAPTISEVVMWLYEKYEIWVYTKPVLDEDGEWIFKGYVKYLNDFKAKEYQTKLLREPTEAYEAAIEYVLKNLI